MCYDGNSKKLFQGGKMEVLVIGESPINKDLGQLFQNAWLPIANIIVKEMGAEGIKVVEEEAPDLVVLESNLPFDGLKLLNTIRKVSDVPIVVLSSSRAGEVEWLNNGADDFIIVAPFYPDIFIAKVKAVLRRCLRIKTANHLELGDLIIDWPKRDVRFAGKVINLSPTEFALLYVLATHEGAVVDRKVLVKEVWGEESHLKYLKLYIGYLKRKLAAVAGNSVEITNKPWFGYRLIVQGDG